MSSKREHYQAFQDINKAIADHKRSKNDSLETILARIENEQELDVEVEEYGYALTADEDFDNIVKHGLKRGTNLLRFPIHKCKGGYVERRFIEVFLDGDEYDDTCWIPLGALR